MGMGTDFCQQKVSVTMVTRQRSDVIASIIGAWHGGGILGVLQCESFFTLSSLLSHIRRNYYSVSEFVYLEIFVSYSC